MGEKEEGEAKKGWTEGRREEEKKVRRNRNSIVMSSK